MAVVQESEGADLVFNSIDWAPLGKPEAVASLITDKEEPMRNLLVEFHNKEHGTGMLEKVAIIGAVSIPVLLILYAFAGLLIEKLKEGETKSRDLDYF